MDAPSPSIGGATEARDDARDEGKYLATVDEGVTPLAAKSSRKEHPKSRKEL